MSTAAVGVVGVVGQVRVDDLVVESTIETALGHTNHPLGVTPPPLSVARLEDVCAPDAPGVSVATVASRSTTDVVHTHHQA